MPKTTASMMIAASTAFGSCEKSGASATRVRITSPPVASEAIGLRAPADSLSELADRLVETGIPWKAPDGDVRHPLRDRLLVDVDAVAVADGERAGVAGRLREADQEQAGGGREDGRVVLLEDVEPGQRRRRQAARHVPDERDTVRAEVEQPRGQQARDDEHEGARHARREEAQAEDERRAPAGPTSSVVQLMSPRVRSHEASSPRRCRRSSTCRSASAARRSTTSTAAPARKPVTTARERNRAIQPMRSSASRRNSAPVTSVIAATSSAASAPPTPVNSTAPPATAASDELGPVEMCREVQNSA